MSHFNKLTPAEAEALALLTEEGGEVIQAVAKILRHGIDSEHPDSGELNKDSLNKEIGDVLAAIDICFVQWVADREVAEHHKQRKLSRVGRYLHHAVTEREYGQERS
jgi:NTP pyrophosphatase (non-canonical NTP hydrolase)